MHRRGAKSGAHSHRARWPYAAALNVTDPRLFETQYHSPQLPLWELGDGDWLKIVWLGRYVPRRAMRAVVGAQLPLFEPDTID